MSFDASGEYVPEPEPVECPRCEGTGHIGGSSHGRYLPDTCQVCGGEGVVEVDAL